jgi:hypothetical protein
MVHFPGFARVRLWIHRTVIRVYRIGFPHSEIPGSKPACGSPRLIAACHVLHRHRLPRHPPCALSSLTIKFTQHIRDPEPRQRLCKLYVAICSSLRLASATPADIRQLIKFNTQPCRLPNLFSCQTSSAIRRSLPAWAGRANFCSRFNADCCRRSTLSRSFGGADRDRTGDPLVANQVLSQLSYSPTIDKDGGPGKN